MYNKNQSRYNVVVQVVDLLTTCATSLQVSVSGGFSVYVEASVNH